MYLWRVLMVGVIGVAELAVLWNITANIWFPVFSETAQREIEVVGVSHYISGVRGETDCHELLPHDLYVRVHVCDIDPIQPQHGDRFIVEFVAADLEAAEKISKSVRRDEPQEVCAPQPWYLFTEPKCHTERPSNWHNSALRYQFATLNAYALGTIDDPPAPGDWKWGTGLVGLFLTLGSLFVAVLFGVNVWPTRSKE